METPKEYALCAIPLWTQSDVAADLQWSDTYIARFVEMDILAPQFKTLRGVVLFTQEYWEWAKVNVPKIAQRVSELSDTT